MQSKIYEAQRELLNKGFHKPIENLEERLTTSSTQLSKYQKSSLWQRYWTAAVVGIISALLTNLLLVIL